MPKVTPTTIVSVCLFILYLLSAHLLPAQTPTADSAWIRKSSFIVLPIAFYAPETRLGFGGASVYAFRFRGEPDSLRPSQVQLGLAYTLENQLLSYLPFQIFYDEAKYNIYGELGYYRYFYRYFGIGNATRLADEEIYSATFPRVRLNVLRLLRPKLYAGLRYWFDDYRITERAEAGELIRNDLVGSEGGIVSALGAVAIYDSRDYIFFPTRGALIETVWLSNSRTLGSDFNFNRFSLDASIYHTFRWQHTLALNGFVDFTFGDTPFFQLPLIGGTRRLRGYWEGRFRQEKLWIAQAEYRFPLFWRFGMVAFGGVGSVAPELSAFGQQRVHYSVGSGLRILLSKNDRINVRVDVGIDETGRWLPYITVGEAF
ncbi:MAG TPA: BamA/TamA family outer membrane protein [Saprospiraceae bacterium]|nr:BamA/TamA family outer membrane protein [Saprospiraceae bacterium]HMP24456.1 BamA/TamA family outer membrane protein [Saprospiraceae bacterium]